MARSTSDISNSDVGQTSGQWVKPKKIRVGRPCRLFSVTVAPLWSVSWKGPPIATGVATPLTPPSAQNIRSSPTTRLPPKADAITSGRGVRSISNFLFPSGSEAAGDAGRDGLEKHRGPVAEP